MTGAGRGAGGTRAGGAGARGGGADRGAGIDAGMDAGGGGGGDGVIKNPSPGVGVPLIGSLGITCATSTGAVLDPAFLVSEFL